MLSGTHPSFSIRTIDAVESSRSSPQAAPTYPFCFDTYQPSTCVAALSRKAFLGFAPIFAEMVRAGVVPTERVPHQAFWADAKKRVRALPVLAEDSRDARPCECVFRFVGKGRDLPPCTCLAPPGEAHALWCARVWGNDPQREAA